MRSYEASHQCFNIFTRSRFCKWAYTLHWRHNGHDSISNHQPHDCLLNRLFRRRSKKISKLRVTGLCVENSPETGEFPAQMVINTENVSIWWRHHASWLYCIFGPWPLSLLRNGHTPGKNTWHFKDNGFIGLRMHIDTVCQLWSVLGGFMSFINTHWSGLLQQHLSKRVQKVWFPSTKEEVM